MRIRRLLEFAGNYRHIWTSITVCVLLITFVLFLLPKEQMLGNTIKIIYVHVTLVQASLLAFAAAGILGLIHLFVNSDKLFQWGAAFQKSAILFWILYYLTSMVATYMTWGVWIEWTEPRVHIAFRVIAASTILFVLTIWVAKKIFTNVSNFVLAIFIIYTTKSAVNVRHPGSPIGDSESFIYRAALWAVFILTMIILVQINHLIYVKLRSPAK